MISRLEFAERSASSADLVGGHRKAAPRSSRASRLIARLSAEMFRSGRRCPDRLRDLADRVFERSSSVADRTSDRQRRSSCSRFIVVTCLRRTAAARRRSPVRSLHREADVASESPSAALGPRSRAQAADGSAARVIASIDRSACRPRSAPRSAKALRTAACTSSESRPARARRWRCRSVGRRRSTGDRGARLAGRIDTPCAASRTHRSSPTRCARVAGGTAVASVDSRAMSTTSSVLWSCASRPNLVVPSFRSSAPAPTQCRGGSDSCLPKRAANGAPERG